MKLADYLTEQGLSKEAFASRVGCTAEAVRLWCKGTRRPRSEAILTIQSATNGAVTWADWAPAEAA